jgi:DNA-binding response OmpR family regulator
MPSNLAQSKSATSARRVLVVEDDPVIQLLLREVLSGRGYDVGVANDGEAGLAAVLRDPPDLVVLDVMMPGLDGYEVLGQLRQRPATAGIPVLLLTALNSDEDIARGFAAGANDYMRKPFQSEDLLSRVSALLEPA